MKPRRILALFAVAGMTAIMAAGCTGGSGDKAGGGSAPVVLTLASRPGVIEWTPGVAYFAKRVGQLSGGALRIEVANSWGGDSDPGSEQRIVRDVRDGKADLGWVGTGAFDTMGINSFQALRAPMLIDSYALERAVIASDIPEQMMKSLDELGVTGLAMIGDSLLKPIAVRAPLLGQKDWNGVVFAIIRSNGEAEAIEALGARSTDVWGPPLSRAFEDGKVQGRDFGLSVYVAANYEGVPYLTANVSLWPQTIVLLANPHVLSTLSDQQRGWLQRAAQDASSRSTNLLDRDVENVTLACQNGGRLENASDADLAWLRRSFAPVYAHLEQDPQTKTFIEAIERLKGSTPAEPPLDIPDSCSGPATGGSGDDPVSGTWQTDKLTEAEFVQAFVAAGGSEKEAHGAFAPIEYMTLTLQFQNGVFKELESDDGRRPEQGYNTTYEIGADDTISMSGCPEPQIYRFEVSGDTLRLYVVKPCGTHDAVYNATLFATFPFTRTG